VVRPTTDVTWCSSFAARSQLAASFACLKGIEGGLPLAGSNGSI
jgi:hypothetical protein